MRYNIELSIIDKQYRQEKVVNSNGTVDLVNRYKLKLSLFEMSFKMRNRPSSIEQVLYHSVNSRQLAGN